MRGNRRAILIISVLLIGLTSAVCRADGIRAVAAKADKGSGAPGAARVDLTPRPLDWIPPGTVIGDDAPRGWSHLVVIATPRIGVGDVKSVPKIAIKYSSMLCFTILANVRANQGDKQPAFILDRVAMGNALEINGKKVIATSEQTFGRELGFIGKRVFEENENLLKADVRQVVRTPNLLVFDAKGIVLIGGIHTPMILRHALVASPADGKLSTFIWLLGFEGEGEFALAENTLQMMPPNLHEDRVLSVDTSKFTFGIPSNDAFALARTPQGTPVKLTPEFRQLGAIRRFTPESALRLENELQTRYAPLAAQAARPEAVRR